MLLILGTEKISYVIQFLYNNLAIHA